MPWGIKAAEILNRICTELNTDFEKGGRGGRWCICILNILDIFLYSIDSIKFTLCNPPSKEIGY